jgi:hypothetical protein
MLIVAPLLRIADADLNIMHTLKTKLECPGYRTFLPMKPVGP